MGKADGRSPTNGHKVSFGNDENVLKLDNSDAQLYESAKNHLIIYFKGRTVWHVIYISIRLL